MLDGIGVPFLDRAQFLLALLRDSGQARFEGRPIALELCCVRPRRIGTSCKGCCSAAISVFSALSRSSSTWLMSSSSLRFRVSIVFTRKRNRSFERASTAARTASRCLSKRVRKGVECRIRQGRGLRFLQPATNFRNPVLSPETGIAQISPGLGEFLVQTVMVPAGHDEPRHHDHGRSLDPPIR